MTHILRCLALIAPVLLAACSSEPPLPEPATISDELTPVIAAPIKVQTVIVESVDLADPLIASGTIAAKQTIENEIEFFMLRFLNKYMSAWSKQGWAPRPIKP